MTNPPTIRPTCSLPTVSLAKEARLISNSMGEALVAVPFWDGEIDAARMTVEQERDFIVCPSWSDGTEVLFVLGRFEHVTFRPNLDENGHDRLGLHVTVTLRSGETDSWTIDGFARVMRHGS